ncbi:MAG: stringent starvation protein SspA [Candidatus Dasytiphilus stammeri]
MAVPANKHSVMTLFSSSTDIFSHQVRIVLAEKGVSVEIEQIDLNHKVQSMIDSNNPYHTIPTLIDRELTLYNSRIIMEYLDERYPHPPLMPVYPVSRGNSRLMMYRVENDLYSLKKIIEKNISPQSEIARLQLREELLAIAFIFGQTPYFMSDEFSLVDCYLAPLLWRLPILGIEIYGNHCKELNNYMARIFNRSTFLTSLTEAEREMRWKKQLNY